MERIPTDKEVKDRKKRLKIAIQKARQERKELLEYIRNCRKALGEYT